MTSTEYLSLQPGDEIQYSPTAPVWIVYSSPHTLDDMISINLKRSSNKAGVLERGWHEWIAAASIVARFVPIIEEEW